MNSGLKTKLLVSLLIPVVVIVAGLSFYNYNAAKTALDEQITKAATYATGDYVGNINAKLADKEMAVSTMASIMGSRPISMEEAAGLIKAVKAADKDILNVFFGLENKQYLETNGWVPPADYDPTGRSWYKKAVGAEDIVYSDVYEDAGTHQLVVSICRKIIINGQLAGVIGVDLDLKQYAAIAQGIKPGKTGYGFILDAKGNYIYIPR